MADSHETFGQHMKQETSDKFLDWECSGFQPVPVFSITVGESNLPIFDRKDPVVGQSDAVNVAAEVVEQVLGRAERLFGVDDPRVFSQSLDQEVKVPSIGQGSGFARKNKLLLIEGVFEKVQELTTEDSTQGFDTKEEVFARGDPAVLIEREHSFWEQAVEVKVILELLIPGMQDQGKARGSLKVPLSKFQQGLADRLEQQIEQEFFVYQDERVEIVT